MTTAARMLKAPVRAVPQRVKDLSETSQEVIVKPPHEVWHVYLTVVPTRGGFWVPWLPFGW